MTEGGAESLTELLGRRDAASGARLLERSAVADAAAADASLAAASHSALVDGPARLIGELSSSQGQAFARAAKGRLATIHADATKEEARARKRLHRGAQAQMDRAAAAEDQRERRLRKELADQPAEVAAEALAYAHEEGNLRLAHQLHSLQLNAEQELQTIRQSFRAEKEKALARCEREALKELEKSGKIRPEALAQVKEDMKAVRERVRAEETRQKARHKAHLDTRYKLRRRLLALQNKNNLDTRQMLDMVRAQAFKAIESSLRRGDIKESGAEKLRSEVGRWVADLKGRLEREAADAQHKLAKRAAQERRQKTDALKAKQEAELAELGRSGRKGRDSSQSREELLSAQAAETARLSQKMDLQEAKDLEALELRLREDLTKRMADYRASLAKQRVEMRDGEPEELERFARKRVKESEERREKLARKLKEEDEKTASVETKETEAEAALEEHEKKLFQHLVGQQTALSEEERAELMEAQQSHLAALTQSLAARRLSEFATLQDRIAKRRASALESLERKDLSRRPRSQFPQRDPPDLGYDSDAELRKGKEEIRNAAELSRARLAAVEELGESAEKEMAEVERELLEKRARSLRQQENRLGGLVARLELRRAKLVAEVERSSEALSGLTSTMVEDLTERGVLSNPDCQRLLRRHEEEQRQLQDKLSTERRRSERQLREELEARRSATPADGLRASLSASLRRSRAQPHSSEVAARIADMDVILHHAMDAESRTAADQAAAEQSRNAQRRDFELLKTQALQDQELDLVSQLVQAGDFQKEEMESVLTLVFPHKSAKDLRKMMQRVGGSEEGRGGSRGRGSRGSGESGGLRRRFQATREEQLAAERRERRREGRRAESGASSDSGRPRSGHLPSISSRRPNHPLNASVEEAAEYLPPRRLSKMASVASTYHL